VWLIIMLRRRPCPVTSRSGVCASDLFIPVVVTVQGYGKRLARRRDGVTVRTRDLLSKRREFDS